MLCMFLIFLNFVLVGFLLVMVFEVYIILIIRFLIKGKKRKKKDF